MLEDELGTVAADEAADITPFGRRLKAAIEVVVAQMCKDELIEVARDRMEDLVMEATRSGMDAASPKHLIKQVRHTLLDSDFVEEVYASDDAIDELLRAAMEA